MKERQLAEMKRTMSERIWGSQVECMRVTSAPDDAGTDDPIDYHGNFTAELFEKWFAKLVTMCDKRYGKCIYIMDGARYHKRQLNKAPTTSDRKETIKAWLTSNGIAFEPGLKKADLCRLVSQHREGKARYAVREIAEKVGHEVAYTPPYHPMLQPIEHIWGIIKNWTGRLPARDMGVLEARIREAAAEKANEDVWIRTWRHILGVEDRMLAEDKAARAARDPEGTLPVAELQPPVDNAGGVPSDDDHNGGMAV